MKKRTLLFLSLFVFFSFVLIFNDSVNVRAQAKESKPAVTGGKETTAKAKKEKKQVDDSNAGIFEGFNTAVRIFYVRYTDKMNNAIYYTATYYFDDKTKVIFKEENLPLDQLEAGNKVKVVVRSKGGGRHFNIEKSEKHIAEEIIILEK